MKDRCMTRLLLVIGLLLSPALWAADENKPVEKKVYIYSWSDYLGPETLKRFEQKTGIQVVFDVYDSNDMLEAKLLAGNTGYDVVFPTYFPYFLRQVKAGIYQPLDSARLPNLKGVDKKFDDPLNIDGKRYGAPFMWGTVGIGYNVDKIAAIFGKDFKPNDWGFVFDPANAQKLAQCGIVFMNSPIYLAPIMMKYLGLDPKSVQYDDYAKAMAQFSKVQPYVRHFHDSQYINDLATGNACVAIGWSGDLIIARERAKLAAKPVNIAYVNPVGGAPLIYDVMAVPMGAKNIDAAYQFIDFMLEPETMAELTDYNYFPSPVPASKALLNPKLRDDASIYPPQNIMDQLFVQGELPLSVEQRVNRDWNQMKAGKAANAN
jgi:putrescine transport system substrate-binding protein